MQLAASGPQNAYLDLNPEGTLFKRSYKRITPYAAEHIVQTFNGTPDFGRQVSCTISRSADLIHRVYLRVNLPALSGTGTQAWTHNIGNVMIDYVTIEIGGQQIDKHYGLWLHIWSEFTQEASLEPTYNVMIGETTQLTTEASSVPAATLYVPLRFWFCRDIGLSLPLIALTA